VAVKICDVGESLIPFSVVSKCHIVIHFFNILNLIHSSSKVCYYYCQVRRHSGQPMTYSWRFVGAIPSLLYGSEI
jgi:hypothetical protein